MIAARDRALVDDLIRTPYPHLTPGPGPRPGRQRRHLTEPDSEQEEHCDVHAGTRREPRRSTWVSLLGLILVPLLVAGGFLWATWNSDTRLDRVAGRDRQQRRGYHLNDQFVPLGRQLAGGLVNGEDDASNFDWVLTDTEDARGRMPSGTYAAVVTIPEDFSTRATSFSKTEVADIEPATIEVQTSQVSGITDGVVAQVITTAATGTLNTELTEQYLDNIYLGLQLHQEAVPDRGQGRPQAGRRNGDLSDGLDQTSDGRRKLADGLEQLDDGTSQLSTGAGQLSTGVSQLSDGPPQARRRHRRAPQPDSAAGRRRLRRRRRGREAGRRSREAGRRHHRVRRGNGPGRQGSEGTRHRCWQVRRRRADVRLRCGGLQ